MLIKCPNCGTSQPVEDYHREVPVTQFYEYDVKSGEWFAGDATDETLSKDDKVACFECYETMSVEEFEDLAKALTP